MGQTCSTVQTSVDRATMLRLVSEDASIEEKVRRITEQHEESLRQRLKKITYIENTEELIYQWNNCGQQVVEHLKVQTWPQIQISIESIIRPNILLIKQTTPSKAYKFITLNQCKTVEPHDLIHPCLAFHTSQQLVTLPQLSQSLIQHHNLYLNPAILLSEPFTFIQQSQAFEHPAIPLKILSSYMKKTGICWQDREFLGLAQMCFRKMNGMHDCGRFGWEQVLVDRNGEVYVMGGGIALDLSQQDTESKIKQLAMLDTTWLLIYLLESLYSIKLEPHSLLHTSQLQQLVQHQQSLSKFKHSSTITFLQQIYLNPTKQPSIQTKLSDLTSSLQSSSIRHYVDSYMSKLTLPPSLQIAEYYIQLNQLFKAKQVFFQLLGLSLYDQKHSASKQPSKPNLVNKLLQKAHTSKPQIQHSFQILHRIILLQRKINHYSSEQTQLQTLTNEYVTLSLILSATLRKSSDYTNSLSLLQQTLRFIEQQSISWQLHLHIAQVHFYLNNIPEAERHFCQSLKIEVNQANVCLAVMFYSAVMNWEKAAGMVRDYESLIEKDQVYQLLVAKGCLVRGLAMATRVKDSEEKRVEIFYEAINVAKRVLDRKNVAQIILCQVYQVIGDAHFYLRQFDKAQKNYEKSLAIASSLEYRTKQPQKPPIPFQVSNLQNRNSTYNSRLSQSLSYNRTASVQSRYENSLRKPPQQPNQTFTLDSFLELQEHHTMTSFVCQFRMLFNFDKIAILLTSIANCHFGQNNFSEALKTYEQASKSLSSHNVDLKNSILGNMALCYVQQGKGMVQGNKKNVNSIQNKKIVEGKQLLQQILQKTSEQTPQKLNNDINYMFLAHELNSI